MAQNDGLARKVVSHTITSQALNEARDLKVYIPPDGEDTKHPILYCHDGREFFTHGRIATIAHRLITSGQLQPMYIVGMAVNPAHRTDDYAYHGVRSAAYGEFVLNECVPFIENLYAIDQTSRYMAGVSLGAAATLRIVAHDDEAFTKMLLFSGAFYEDVLRAIDRNALLLSSGAYWMCVGEQETEVKTPTGTYDFLEASRVAASRLRAQGANVTYREAPGQHLWGFWQSQLPDALTWLNK
ncbi:alpha/beta hydrolase [Ferroacidibacillus organovorans]|uniref:Enterochelin esterase n=1 Tax=Ferroacidibacillus organovorans TaxID=1765683 RepID=A0A168C5F5_9BACL|nr:alpha/beta hydrolase-fold protein [Ferroacidibacillus organovorans]KYP81562.1 hypothetical protein AYJ22_06960 [Ferroacidibacillus organovorans]OAG94103.1 hypothetical protein AYW79_07145 [Ferroacidibacillus organovorans]OPG16315.1 hypothetical protein B2M26_07305 [Ferroacidibacillus organovorans]